MAHWGIVGGTLQILEASNFQTIEKMPAVWLVIMCTVIRASFKDVKGLELHLTHEQPLKYLILWQQLYSKLKIHAKVPTFSRLRFEIQYMEKWLPSAQLPLP